MKEYCTGKSESYEPESQRTGFLSIDILECLHGKPWDEVALAYVSAMRPSYIRVVRHNQGEHMDARTHRVSVYLGEDGRIGRIRQEVSVWLPDKVAHGDALRLALKYGIDSPQCQWHNDDEVTGYFADGINGGYYKMRKDGSSVPFPQPDAAPDDGGQK